MTKGTEIQDRFLEEMCTEKIPVALYLMNGFQLRGLVQDFDEETVIVENEHRQQLVYKHAISTISPVNRKAEQG